ncbi:MAG: hypothetical protein ACLUE7_05580 [Lachnospirales bacterium]
MKMDCGYTENYLKEKNRMTKNCEISCGDCPLCINNNKTNLLCKKLENTYPEKAIEIVQAWSDKHQAETRAEHFMKMFPNAQLSDDGRPSICVAYFNENIECSLPKMHCKACWDKLYTKGEF